MAPEQALGTANFDHRADIYSLGCTLYFLLAGHPPFPEGTLGQRIVKHQTQQPRDVLLERPDTPPELVENGKRMMAKEPERRCRSMQVVSAALAPLVASSTAAAVPLPRPVKPIAEKPLAEALNGQANDWLAALVRDASVPSASDSGFSRAAKSGKMAAKSRPVAGRATWGGLAALVREKLTWFDTAQRKILGAVCGVAAVAAVAALAAVPLLFTNSPASQTPSQAKAPDKSQPPDAGVVPPADPSLEKKPAFPCIIARP